MPYILFFKEMSLAAELFLMTDVRNECIAYYIWSLSDDNCFTIKDIADVTAMTELSEKCLNHALRRFKLVVGVSSLCSKFWAWIKIISQVQRIP